MKESKVRVYKLQCGASDKWYIGQTDRNVDTMLTEYNAGFKHKGKDKSAYDSHLLWENHILNQIFVYYKILVKVVSYICWRVYKLIKL